MTLFSRASGIWAPERFRQTPRALARAWSPATGMFYYPPTDKPAPDPKQDPHTTDRIAEEAVAFIEAHRDRPFFAYLPFLDVHTPLKAHARSGGEVRTEALAGLRRRLGPGRQRKVRLVQNHAIYAAWSNRRTARSDALSRHRPGGALRSHDRHLYVRQRRALDVRGRSDLERPATSGQGLAI